MADDTNAPAPDAAPAPAPAAQPETFTADEVRAIVEAERKSATSANAADPVARFRATVGAKQPEQKQAPESSLDRLAKLMEMQLTHSLSQSPALRPPPPPKPMSVDEKLSSDDPSVWLGRNPANAITAADRAQLVQRHASKLAAEGFRGDVEREANARTAREISTAFTRAVGHVKVTAGPTNEAANMLEVLRRGR